MTEVTAYRTTMHSVGRNTGIPVPVDVLERLGGGRRAAVRVTVNGYSFRSTVGTVDGRLLIPFSLERREESGIAAGNELTVELSLDTVPREIDVPDDLAAALATAGVRDSFDRLPPSHRKAHVTAVESAKAVETRQRRIAAAVAKVQQG